MQRSTSKTVIILLIMGIALACTKEDAPDVPCLGSFYCKIDGTPLIVKSKGPCSRVSASYNKSSGRLSVTGTNCYVGLGEFQGVTIGIDSIFSSGGTYHDFDAAAAEIDSSGYSRFYTLHEGEVKVTGFVADNYSENCSCGYASGTFNFTLISTDNIDTVRVTEGSFCVRT